MPFISVLQLEKGLKVTVRCQSDAGDTYGKCKSGTLTFCFLIKALQFII